MSNKVGVEHQAVEFEINEWYDWINILIETDCLSMGEFLLFNMQTQDELWLTGWFGGYNMLKHVETILYDMLVEHI